LGIDVVELGGGDQSIHGGSPLTAPVGAAEGPIFSSDSDTAQRSFGGIIGQADFAIGQEVGEGGPAVKRIRQPTTTLSLTAAAGQIGVERQWRVSIDAKCQPSYQP
jgi:hypothetical protein